MFKQFTIITLSLIFLIGLTACSSPDQTATESAGVPPTPSPSATAGETEPAGDSYPYPAATFEPSPVVGEIEPTDFSYPYPVASPESREATEESEPAGPSQTATETPGVSPTPSPGATASETVPAGDSYPYPVGSPPPTPSPGGSALPGDSYPYPVASPETSAPGEGTEQAGTIEPYPVTSPETGAPPTATTPTEAPEQPTAALSPSPAASIVPRRTPRPTPKPTQPPVFVPPITASAGVIIMGWSPDGRYLSFLTQTRVDVANNPTEEGDPAPHPGMVHFYDVETGEHCQYRQDNPRGLNFNRWFGWLPDGRLAVLTSSGGLAVLDSPCANTTVSNLPGLSGSVQDVLLADAGGKFLLLQGETGCRLYKVSSRTARPLPGCSRAAAFSPSGNRLALTIRENGAGTSTSIFDTSTGKLTRSIEWAFTGEVGELPGPVWLDDSRFLIPRTDKGPQLVTLGADFRVRPVAETFFGIPGSASQYVEVATALEGANAFHLLLMELRIEGRGGTRAFLYHSENNVVEELRYPSGDFSPDGQYLDLSKPVVVNEIEELEHWLRPVDPLGSKETRFTSTEDQNFPSLSPDGRIAVARLVEPGSPTTLLVQDATSGETMKAWFVDPYTFTFSWSPTGEVLAATGAGLLGGEQALYLFATK